MAGWMGPCCAYGSGLGLGGLKGPFQPKLFCDSVNTSLNYNQDGVEASV